MRSELLVTVRSGQLGRGIPAVRTSEGPRQRDQTLARQRAEVSLVSETSSPALACCFVLGGGIGFRQRSLKSAYVASLWQEADSKGADSLLPEVVDMDAVGGPGFYICCCIVFYYIVFRIVLCLWVFILCHILLSKLLSHGDSIKDTCHRCTEAAIWTHDDVIGLLQRHGLILRGSTGTGPEYDYNKRL